MRRKGIGVILLWLLVASVACRSESAGAAGKAGDSGSSAVPAAAAMPAPPVKPALPTDPVFDETANFLAGRPCETPGLKAFQETEEYRSFMAALDKSWAELESNRFLPMRTWAGTEIADADAATKTLFYPFGGPDGLTAEVLFPRAGHYVLLGLEFVGRMPDFETADTKRISAYFQNLQVSLKDFLNKSYFITKNMNEALSGDKVDGVLPLLCFFLKRTGNVISSIQRLDVLENGEAAASPYPGERTKFRRPYGIKIDFFAEGTDVLRTMSYFSCDLVDDVFRKDTPFHAYLAGLPFETTFVKSASYLMHYKEFSNIRSLILEKSRFILEDDTGIPYRYFPPAVWDVRLYGEYIKPVSDFSGVEQLDLKTAYADPARVKPLPFHIGYHWGTNKDSILYIVKK
jgi:hypothetical protein